MRLRPADTTSPTILVVGVDDRVAARCCAAALEAGFHFVRVAHGPAAVEAIGARRPDAVLIPRSLWRDERDAVSRAAAAAGAALLELPEGSTPAWIALAIRRSAAIARSGT